MDELGVGDTGGGGKGYQGWFLGSRLEQLGMAV